MKNSFGRVAFLMGMSFLMLFFPLLISACAAPTSKTTPGSGQTTTATTPAVSAATSEQTFTLEQLAQYDGQNGHRAYIAVDGVVYDVTDVAVWDSKLHAGKFQAGKDYTRELAEQAPHGASKLDQAKRVGTLIS